MSSRSIGCEEARRIVRERFEPGGTVERPLREALGLALARDLASDLSFPPYDRITMDGYAVRAADLAGASAASPRRLSVRGVAAAGEPFEGELGEKEAVRAMTGAPLPAGADAVVRVEDTAGFDAREAVIHVAPEPGANVARRGEDLEEGERLLPAGTVLGVQHVQALASAGWARVPVIAPPTAAVFSTGAELVALERRPGPGQIRDSNRPAVELILRTLGIETVQGASLPDDPLRLRAALEPALAGHELVVLSGGVSRGERDHVKAVLRDCGVSLHFESLHLKPGHPATFGTHAGGAVLALPGNPVAVVATLLAIFSVGLRRRLGHAQVEPPWEGARLDFDFRRATPRTQLLPVRVERSDPPGLPRLRPAEHHGSGDFVSLARAGAFCELEGDPRLHRAGERVRMLPLPPRWT